MSTMRKVKDGKGALNTLFEGKSARLHRGEEDGPAKPKEKRQPVAEEPKKKAPVAHKIPANAKDDLGVYYRMEDLTFGMGFTSRKMQEPLNYYVFLLTDGQVHVEYATPSGKASGMNKMVMTKEKFDSEFTPKDSELAHKALDGLIDKDEIKGEASDAADGTDAIVAPEDSDSNQGICTKGLDIKVGTGGTSNLTHTEIYYHFTYLPGEKVEVVEATPKGKPWPGMKPKVISKEDFNKDYHIH